MFITTVINFLLSSMATGTQVARLIVLTRKVLILDTDYPLSVKQEQQLVDNALRNPNIVGFWAGTLPVSIQLSLSDPVSDVIYPFPVEIYLSDLIVIWRGWALFPDRQWVVLIPFILWIGAVGEYTYSGSCSLWLNLYTPRDERRRPNMVIDSQ